MGGQVPEPNHDGFADKYNEAGRMLFGGTGLANWLSTEGTSLTTNRDVPVTTS